MRTSTLNVLVAGLAGSAAAAPLPSSPFVASPAVVDGLAYLPHTPLTPAQRGEGLDQATAHIMRSIGSIQPEQIKAALKRRELQGRGIGTDIGTGVLTNVGTNLFTNLLGGGGSGSEASGDTTTTTTTTNMDINSGDNSINSNGDQTSSDNVNSGGGNIGGNSQGSGTNINVGRRALEQRGLLDMIFGGGESESGGDTTTTTTTTNTDINTGDHSINSNGDQTINGNVISNGSDGNDGNIGGNGQGAGTNINVGKRALEQRGLLDMIFGGGESESGGDTTTTTTNTDTTINSGDGSINSNGDQSSSGNANSGGGNIGGNSQGSGTNINVADASALAGLVRRNAHVRRQLEARYPNIFDDLLNVVTTNSGDGSISSTGDQTIKGDVTANGNVGNSGVIASNGQNGNTNINVQNKRALAPGVGSDIFTGVATNVLSGILGGGGSSEAAGGDTTTTTTNNNMDINSGDNSINSNGDQTSSGNANSGGGNIGGNSQGSGTNINIGKRFVPAVIAGDILTGVATNVLSDVLGGGGGSEAAGGDTTTTTTNTDTTINSGDGSINSNGDQTSSGNANSGGGNIGGNSQGSGTNVNARKRALAPGVGSDIFTGVATNVLSGILGGGGSSEAAGGDTTTSTSTTTTDINSGDGSINSNGDQTSRGNANSGGGNIGGNSQGSGTNVNARKRSEQKPTIAGIVLAARDDQANGNSGNSGVIGSDGINGNQVYIPISGSLSTSLGIDGNTVQQVADKFLSSRSIDPSTHKIAGIVLNTRDTTAAGNDNNSGVIGADGINGNNVYIPISGGVDGFLGVSSGTADAVVNKVGGIINGSS